MAKQFPVKRFARGVKLTTQHVNDPLTAIKTEASDANLQDTVESKSRFKLSWVLPWTGPASVSKEGNPVMTWPFLAPPFQQLFDRITLQDPQYPVSLTEFSLSIDQRAEPFAVTGYGAVGGIGNLTNVDMTRYNMTLRLYERQPSLLTGDTQSVEEIGKWEIDGVNAFGIQQSASGGTAGNGVARANPLVISEQNLAIRPWNVYLWELSCPGLYKPNTPGVKDKWTVTLGGSPSADDILQLSINGTVYWYKVIAGDTLTTIATAIALAAAADPLYTVTSLNNVITLTEITASSNINTITSTFVVMTTTGTGTTFLAHIDTGKAGVVNGPLELVSFHLCATLEAPLTTRDKQGDFGVPGDPDYKPIQNLPTVHGGASTGTIIPYSPVAANALITGDDVQDGMHGFDRALRQRAGSGYGAGYGPLATPIEASNTYPEEMLANDAHYSMIMVPMWGGQYRESVRKLTVVNAGLPYVDLEVGPANKITEDVFVFPVPEGFVLHHAFAVWNGYSSPTTVYGDDTALDATWPTNSLYTQKVGIILNSGWRSDDYKHQQVAYLQWNGGIPAGNPDSYQNWLLDEYSPDGSPRYRLLQIPLVNDNVIWDNHSWFSSGSPFYMGRANTMTEDREDCGTMPTGYPGCVAFAPPLTGGRENVLEVRWAKDLSNYELMLDTDTIIGQGGEWVILCGKQVLNA